MDSASAGNQSAVGPIDDDNGVDLLEELLVAAEGDLALEEGTGDDFPAGHYEGGSGAKNSVDDHDIDAVPTGSSHQDPFRDGMPCAPPAAPVPHFAPPVTTRPAMPMRFPVPYLEPHSGLHILLSRAGGIAEGDEEANVLDDLPTCSKAPGALERIGGCVSSVAPKGSCPPSSDGQCILVPRELAFLLTKHLPALVRQYRYCDISKVHTLAAPQRTPSGDAAPQWRPLRHVTIGIVISKYQCGGGRSATGDDGAGQVRAPSRSGIVKLWNGRGLLGDCSQSQSILALLITSAHYEQHFSKLMPGDVVLFFNSEVTESNNSGNDSHCKYLFRASRGSTFYCLGRAADVRQCQAITGASGGGSGAQAQGQQCRMLVNINTGPNCYYHSPNKSVSGLLSAMKEARREQSTLRVAMSHSPGIPTDAPRLGAANRVSHRGPTPFMKRSVVIPVDDGSSSLKKFTQPAPDIKIKKGLKETNINFNGPNINELKQTYNSRKSDLGSALCQQLNAIREEEKVAAIAGMQHAIKAQSDALLELDIINLEGGTASLPAPKDMGQTRRPPAVAANTKQRILDTSVSLLQRIAADDYVEAQARRGLLGGGRAAVDDASPLKESGPQSLGVSPRERAAAFLAGGAEVRDDTKGKARATPPVPYLPPEQLGPRDAFICVRKGAVVGQHEGTAPDVVLTQAAQREKTEEFCRTEAIRGLRAGPAVAMHAGALNRALAGGTPASGAGSTAASPTPLALNVTRRGRDILNNAINIADENNAQKLRDNMGTAVNPQQVSGKPSLLMAKKSEGKTNDSCHWNTPVESTPISKYPPVPQGASPQTGARGIRSANKANSPASATTLPAGSFISRATQPPKLLQQSITGMGAAASPGDRTRADKAAAQKATAALPLSHRVVARLDAPSSEACVSLKRHREPDESSSGLRRDGSNYGCPPAVESSGASLIKPQGPRIIARGPTAMMNGRSSNSFSSQLAINLMRIKAQQAASPSGSSSLPSQLSAHLREGLSTSGLNHLIGGDSRDAFVKSVLDQFDASQDEPGVGTRVYASLSALDAIKQLSKDISEDFFEGSAAHQELKKQHQQQLMKLSLQSLIREEEAVLALEKIMYVTLSHTRYCTQCMRYYYKDSEAGRCVAEHGLVTRPCIRRFFECRCQRHRCAVLDHADAITTIDGPEGSSADKKYAFHNEKSLFTPTKLANFSCPLCKRHGPWQPCGAAPTAAALRVLHPCSSKHP